MERAKTLREAWGRVWSNAFSLLHGSWIGRGTLLQDLEKARRDFNDAFWYLWPTYDKMNEEERVRIATGLLSLGHERGMLARILGEEVVAKAEAELKKEKSA